MQLICIPSTKEGFLGVIQLTCTVALLGSNLSVNGVHVMDTVIHTNNEKTLPETANVIDRRGVNNMKVFHCTVCGQLKPLIKDGQKYCGINCNMRAYRERKKKSQWKICAFCGEGFIPSRSDQKCCKKSHRVALCRQLKKVDAS